jgi:hypothetical protein
MVCDVGYVNMPATRVVIAKRTPASQNVQIASIVNLMAYERE